MDFRVAVFINFFFDLFFFVAIWDDFVYIYTMSLTSRTFEIDEHKVEASSLEFYGSLLDEIKTRIRKAQVKASLSANAEMIALYWDIGKLIFNRQKQEGWGAGVIPRLAKDIKNELPEIKGFSERNIKFMVQLFKEYESDAAIGKQAVSQLENVKRLVSQIPWGHNILLMQRIKEKAIRIWYIEQTIQNGWSRDILGLMIKSAVHLRQGNAVTNFNLTLPENLKSSLPSIEEIEAELGKSGEIPSSLS